MEDSALSGLAGAGRSTFRIGRLGAWRDIAYPLSVGIPAPARQDTKGPPPNRRTDARGAAPDPGAQMLSDAPNCHSRRVRSQPMSEREGLVAVVKCLEPEQVPLAVSMRQDDFASSQDSATLCTAVADDRRE
jgi:hypothetical protein